MLQAGAAEGTGAAAVGVGPRYLPHHRFQLWGIQRVREPLAGACRSGGSMDSLPDDGWSQHRHHLLTEVVSLRQSEADAAAVGII